jgi:hypothetical protein
MATNYKEKTMMIIDKFSGELLKDETIVEYETKLPSEPPYVKLYTTDLGNLFKLPVGTTGVLMCVASMVDYQGVVVLNGYFKESIARRLNSKLSKNGKPSISVVNKAITELLNKEIISRIGSSTYQLNPNLFARGKWRDIYEQRKAFKLTITYSHDENGGKREVITEQIGADILQFPTTEGEIL